MPYADAILDAVARSGRSAREVSIAAVGHESAIRSLKRGQDLRASTIEALCRELGIEFQVGPPRTSDAAEGSSALPPASLRVLETGARTLNRVVVDSGGNPIPDDLWPVLEARRGREVPLPSNEDLPPGARPVDVVELAAIAGGGADAASEDVAGCVWFRQDWLDRRGLDPSQCAVIRVSGESMEPLLSEGASILVDRKRRRRVEGRIFVVRTGDGLIVKRAGRDGDGKWRLLSEHPSWAPAPWPSDAKTIGQAVWTARSLV